MKCGTAMDSTTDRPTPPALPDAPEPLIPRWVWPAVLPAITFGALAAVLSYRAAGPSLGLFIGPVVLAAVLTPALAAAVATLVQRVVLAGAYASATAAVWLYAAATGAITLGQWGVCVLVLFTFVLAIAGLVALLGRTRLPPSGSVALVTLVALAWLTWPIWLLPQFERTTPAADHPTDGEPRMRHIESIANALGAANPFFAINTPVRHFQDWPHKDIAYRYLTDLGEDFAFTAFPNATWSILLHGLIGAGALAGARGWGRQRGEVRRDAARPDSR